MSVDEIIEKLRTNSGWWEGDQNARRVLQKALVKGVDPSPVVSMLPRWIEEVKFVITHPTSTYRLEDLVHEMQRQIPK